MMKRTTSRLHCTFVTAIMGLAGIAQAGESQTVLSILEFGAKPGIDNLSTEAIQAAIDACHERGGGTVLFPKGLFVTGTLFLKSNVHLDFEDRAKLYGSTSLDDHAEMPVATEEPHFSKCLFYAQGVENVTITGKDTSEFNGRGYDLKFSLYNKENVNNDGMNFDGCSNVWIKDSLHPPCKECEAEQCHADPARP